MLHIFSSFLRKRDESELPAILREGIGRTHREHIYPKSPLYRLDVEPSYLPTTKTLGEMLGLANPEHAPAVRRA